MNHLISFADRAADYLIVFALASSIILVSLFAYCAPLFSDSEESD